MPIHRHWLSWNEPCLPQAAAWLIDHAAKLAGQATTRSDTSRGVCDLGGVMTVLPGRRAARELLAELIEACRERGVRLVPPRVLTPGAMVDAVLAVASVATPWERLGAWMQALQSAEDEELRHITALRPEPGDAAGWFELARLMARLQEDLAAGRVNFINAASETDRLAMVAEGDRWRAMDLIARRYLGVLRRQGMNDPHAAREAALREGELAFHGPLVLIGVAEMNEVQKAAVRRANASADGEGKATALVFAPSSVAERFDDCGCVIPEFWRDAMLGVRDDQIEIVDRPEDQSQAALRVIAELDGRFGPDEISIGLGDPALGATLRRHAAWAGVVMRPAAGTSADRSLPARLLDAAAAWIAEPQFANLAALLRHPDAEMYVLRRLEGREQGVNDWLGVLDRYFSDHLNQRLTGEWLGEPVQAGRMKAAHDAVRDLLRPLTDHREVRPLGEWAQPILDVLAAAYGDRPAEAADEAALRTVKACAAVRDVAAEMIAASPGLQPRVTAAGALRLLLDALREVPLAVEIDDDHIEMLGWLELHLDSAPVLVVTDCNDGKIPESVPSDGFLPDSLRARLGLASNDRRHARDAYFTEALVQNRRQGGKVVFIAGRRSADGDPLMPSRVLLACDEERVVTRIAHMCPDDEAAGAGGGHGGLPRGLKAAKAGAGRVSAFLVPAIPDDVPIPDRMPVTWFASYLRCPYRFALEHLLRLRGIDDAAAEMDGLVFGSLAHDVLRRFGEDEDAADSASPKAIEAFLLEAARAEARRLFGSRPLAAVRLQLARLEQRLGNFAIRQAAHRKEGWTIRHVELTIDADNLLEIPGAEPIALVGKIDRIDFNEAANRWLIIDYKTGDTPRSPHMAHHGSEKVRDEWIDLQLPLYHMLCGRRGIGGAEGASGGGIGLAYFALPKSRDDTGLMLAAWEPSHLDAAIAKAREIVALIRARRFPRAEDFDAAFDAFARICQIAAHGSDEPDGASGESGE